MTTKEILKQKLIEMEGNKFVKHAREILDCCEDGKYDVGVAMDILKAKDKDTPYTLEEQNEMAKLLRVHPLLEVVEILDEIEEERK